MNNILLTGGPGTGKTFLARAMAFYLCERGLEPDDVYGQDILADLEDIENFVQSDRVEFIQVHASMSYEDVVYGMEINVASGIGMRYAPKRVMELCERAEGSGDSFCLILDDLGRANADALLGDLLYGMEYRGQPVTLIDGGAFTVPHNVIIILTECGRMYGAASDHALRRRMDHVGRLVSSRETLERYYGGSPAVVQNTVLDVYDGVRLMVEGQLSADCVPRAESYIPGHGMFMTARNGSANDILLRFKRKFLYQICPYIREMWRNGLLDGDVERFFSDMADRIGGGIAAAESRIVSMEKILYRSGRAPAVFTLEDSRDYYVRTILPNRCGEHRGIMECILDVMILNGIFPYDMLMAELFGNTNVVRFAHRTRPGRYAAFLCEDTENENYGYLTSVSHHLRSYYSSNPVRTGRWVSTSDAPAYEVTDSRGARSRYLYLNAFRNAGFDVGSSEIHAHENTASIYAAVYRLVRHYLQMYEDDMLLLAGADASYWNGWRLAGLERKYWVCLNEEAQRLGGAGNKLCRLCEGIPRLRTLWSRRGDTVEADADKFEDLVSGRAALTTASYGDMYNITGGRPITIEIKGVEQMADLRDYQKIMEDIGVRQMIFQGPPGTSKTFESQRFVLKQLCPGAAALTTAALSADEIAKDLEPYKLTARDYEDPCASPRLRTGGWDLVQFHPSYGYEDFIRGIEVRPVGGTPTYESVNRILGKLAEFAELAKEACGTGPAPKFYLIVDEINRANLATVFGELIYGLEYRGSKVSTPYYVESKVAGTTTKDIVLGDNLFLIGTMNTADKSIDAIDYAVRRRFLFIDSPADRNVVLRCYQSVSGKMDEESVELMLFDAVSGLFDSEDYFNPEYRKSDVRLGHTYFLRKAGADYLETAVERFIFQVIPILREYAKDGILESAADLRDQEHTAGAIVAEADRARRVQMLSEDIMLYVQHFGEQNASGETMDNEYIAKLVTDLCDRLGY